MQDICSRLVALAAKDDSRVPGGPVGTALALLARMLFLENSRPIHRQLLSGLQRLPPAHFALFQDAVLGQVLGDFCLNSTVCDKFIWQFDGNEVCVVVNL